MTSQEYERSVADEFRRRGYQVEPLPDSVDWGAEFFATLDSERLAVRAKRVGPNSRPLSQALVLALEGARRYFDCSGATLVSNGQMSADAHKAAAKLGVGLESWEGGGGAAQAAVVDFDHLWNEHILPLEGTTLAVSGGKGGAYQIIRVDDSGIERVSSRGHSGFLPIELFRGIVRRLLRVGQVSRDEIHALCGGGASSGIAQILAQVPYFEYVDHPARLRVASRQSAALAPLPAEAEPRPSLDAIEGLKAMGFQGFVGLERLSTDLSQVPHQRGVYLVLVAAPGEPQFLLQGSGGHSKGNPNVTIPVLRSNWVADALILYVGKAGGEGTKATLNSRIKQYLDFGRGKPAKHYGGRFIWQLRESGQLLMAWSAAEDPAHLEGQILRNFVEAHGRLPFANLQD